MAIDFVKCADTRCTNRVRKLGDLCPECKKRDIELIIGKLEKKPRTVEEAYHPQKAGDK